MRTRLMFPLLAACASARDNGLGVGTGDDTGLSGADGQTLTELELLIDAYHEWGHPEGWDGVSESGGIHGAYVQIWANADARDTIAEAASAPLPVGSILVKQGYDDAAATELRNLTVSYKLADDDWFYASWDAEGALLEAGRPDLCTGCHASGQDNVLAVTW